MDGTVVRGTDIRDGAARGTAADADGTAAAAVGAADIRRGVMKVDMAAASLAADTTADSMVPRWRTVGSMQRLHSVAAVDSMAVAGSTVAVAMADAGKEVNA